MPLRVFYTSVSGSTQIRKQQERIFSVLDSLKICYIMVDISQRTEDKDLMRTLAKDCTALPPQISNGDDYCGDFTKFEEAIDSEVLEKFLKLK